MSSFVSFGQFIRHGGQASVILSLRAAEPPLELKQSPLDRAAVDSFGLRLRDLAAENCSGIISTSLPHRHSHSLRCRGKFALTPLNLARRRLVKLEKLSMPFTCTPFLAKCFDLLIRRWRSLPTSTRPLQPGLPSVTSTAPSAMWPRIPDGAHALHARDHGPAAPRSPVGDRPHPLHWPTFSLSENVGQSGERTVQSRSGKVILRARTGKTQG